MSFNDKHFKMIKRIIVADIKSSNTNGKCIGHYFALAQNYSDVLSEKYTISIAGGPIYKQHFSKEKMIELPYDYMEEENKFKNFFRMLSNGWCLFRTVNKEDVIILQQSKPAMILLVILLTYFGNSNLFQIQYSEEPMNRRYFRLMMSLKKHSIKGIICPNEIVGKAYKIPFVVVPDYFFVSKNKRILEEVNYINKRYDFCYVGRLNKDKGILEVAKRFSQTQFSLLIAGNTEDETYKKQLQQVCSNCKNIALKIGYLSEEEYDFCIINSKYCIMNYLGEYSLRSSGVVYDALYRRTPVVGRKCSALKIVTENKCGYLYNDLEDFDPLLILEESLYSNYCHNINDYLSRQQSYVNKLLAFLIC